MVGLAVTGNVVAVVGVEAPITVTACVVDNAFPQLVIVFVATTDNVTSDENGPKTKSRSLPFPVATAPEISTASSCIWYETSDSEF